MNDVEFLTRNTLSNLGACSSVYSGADYVIYGISIMLENGGNLQYITKSLYVDIAVHFHTTWNCVEKNIRTAVSAAWNSDNKKLLNDIFGNTRDKKPTNKEFFEYLYLYVTKTAELSSKMDFICPESNQSCEFLRILYVQLVSLMR